jgi:hypothetical protein
MAATTRLSRQEAAEFRAEAISAGRYDLMVAEYLLPLLIFFDGRPQVLRSGSEIWGFFQGFHSAMRAAGLVRLTARVTAEDLPRNGRFRIWTDWSGAGARQPPIVIASTICYCRHTPQGVETEMIEFTRLSLPALRAA